MNNLQYFEEIKTEEMKDNKLNKVGIIFLVLIFSCCSFFGVINAQIVTQPQNLSKCYKSSGIAFIKSTLTTDKYQWQYFDTTWKNIKNDSNWSRSNKDTLIFLNGKGQTVSLNIRCTVDSAGLGKKIYYSNTIKIKSFPQLFASQIQSAQTKCFNFTIDTIKIKTYGSGGDTISQYRWQSRNISGVFADIGNPNDKLLFLGKQKKSLVIRMRLDSKSCGSKYSDSINIKILDSLSAPKIGINQTICFGNVPSSLNILTKAKGASDTFKYVWQSRSIGTSLFSVVDSINKWKYQPKALQKTTFYKLKAVSQLGCGDIFSDSINIKILDSLTAPKIGSNQTICFGNVPSSLNIITKAKGASDTFKYVWQSRSIGTSLFSVVDSTNKWKYQPKALQKTTIYKLKAISQLGCGVVFSDSITVSVYKNIVKPKISKNQVICYNTQPNLIKMDSVALGGNDTFNYNWQTRSLIGTWQDIAAANNSNYQPQKLTSTALYRLKAVSVKGCGTVFSDSIKITVLKQLTIPVISKNQNICYNTQPSQLKVDVKSTGGNDTFSYQFQNRIVSGNWQDISGGVTLNYLPSNLQNTTYYRVKVTSSFGCGTVYSDSIIINVFKPLSIPTISQNQVICYNTQPAQIKVTNLAKGGNDTFGYNWEFEETANNWKGISNATSNTFQPASLIKSTYYRLKATSSVGCGTTASDSIFIKVLPIMEKGILNIVDNIICYNKIPNIKISKTPRGADGLFNNKWYISNDSINFNSTNDTGVIYTHLSQALLSNGRYFLKVVSTSKFGCGTVYSDQIAFTVLPKFSSPKISKNQTICYNSQPGKLEFKNLVSGASGIYQYQWQSSFDKFTWTNINNALNTDYQNGNLKSTNHYRCLIKDNLCGSVYSDTSKITVLADLNKPILNSVIPICYNNGLVNNAVKFKIGNEPKGGNDTFLSFVESSITGKNWNNLGQLPQTGLIENNLKISRYYRAYSISKYGCGTVYSDSVFLLVYDSFYAPIIGNDQTICEGDFLNKKLTITTPHSKGGSSFKYNWQRLNSVQQWIDIIGFDTVHLNKKFYLDDKLRLKVTSNDNCGQLFSNTIQITVRNKPDTFNVYGSPEVCKFAKEKYYEINNNSDYNYNWFSNFGNVSRGQGSHQVYFEWPNFSQPNDTIKLVRTDKLSGCSNVMKFPIVINNTPSPSPTSITQIKNTKILVCQDTSVNLNYNWGYLIKQTKIETIEKNGTLRYHEFQQNIDTNKNIYFVKTSFGNCYTTSYYKFDPWVLSDFDINANRFKIFPNPSNDGKFFISNYKLIESNAFVVYDINGKIVSAGINSGVIDLSNCAKGIYILADKNGYYEHVLLINK